MPLLWLFSISSMSSVSPRDTTYHIDLIDIYVDANRFSCENLSAFKKGEVMLTHHAQIKSSAEGYSTSSNRFTARHWSTEHSKRGLDLIYFDKLGKRSAQSLMKKIGLKQSDHYLKVFLLESSDGDIVTVGHRTKRINRN